jgi:hypothetical protein
VATLLVSTGDYRAGQPNGFRRSRTPCLRNAAGIDFALWQTPQSPATTLPVVNECSAIRRPVNAHEMCGTTTGMIVPQVKRKDRTRDFVSIHFPSLFAGNQPAR